MDEEPITSVPNFIKGILVIGSLAALVTLVVEHGPEVEKLIQPKDEGPRLLLLECNPNKKPDDEFSVRCEVELQQCKHGFLTFWLWQRASSGGDHHLSVGGVDPMSDLANKMLRHIGEGEKKMTLRLKYNLNDWATVPDFIIVGVDSWD